jgi:hypothetical protein
VRLAANGDRFKIEVEDYGIGVAPHILFGTKFVISVPHEWPVQTLGEV